MMTSSNGNIFRVTGIMCGEFAGHRWIPHTKASDAELWCFLWVAPEPTDEQTMKTPVIWVAIVLIQTALVQIMAWRLPRDRPLSDQCCLVYWRIYASLGLNGCMHDAKYSAQVEFYLSM